MLNLRAREAMMARKETFVAIRAKVERADGTPAGDRLVAFAHRNPIIHYALAPLVHFNGWAQERYYRFRNRRKS